MELKLAVTGQNFRVISGSSQLVSSTVNYVNAVCQFSDEWTGLNKWLHLRAPDGQVYDVELDEMDAVTHLNVSAAGLWELWIHGHRTDPELRITTTSDTIQVIPCGMPEHPPLPPLSLSAQEQIASDAAHARAEVAALRQEMAQLDQTVLDVEHNAQLALEAKNSAERCLDKLPYPHPGTKTWWRWNSSTNAYEDTGEQAQGVQGPTGEQGPPGQDFLAPGSTPFRVGCDGQGYYCTPDSSLSKTYLASLGLNGVPVGAAPAGFGLGGAATLIDDANKAVKCGFYAVTGGALHVPFDYSPLWVSNFGNVDYPVQLLTHYAYNWLCMRGGTYKNGSVEWNPWEWVNPPMRVGVEYRTAERYNGAPVYTKLVDCGIWANGKRIEYIPEAELKSVVSLSAQQNGKVTYPNRNSDNYATLLSNAIYLEGSVDNWGGNVLATVKYTKVGD